MTAGSDADRRDEQKGPESPEEDHAGKAQEEARQHRRTHDASGDEERRSTPSNI